MDNFTSRVVDTANPTSVSSRARQHRWQKFIDTFPEVGSMHILDLGGTPNYWRFAPHSPAHVTTLNLARHESVGAIEAIQGDACRPPRQLLSRRFDLVVSNSLIEHVGGHAQRARVADVVHQAADQHWVQTPYRYFPIEPHWMAPGFQLLPFAAKVRVTMMWKLGNRHTTDRQTAVDACNEVELIGLTQMREYFPNSTIWHEKVAGITKSMVAISN